MSNETLTVPVPFKIIPPQDYVTIETINSEITGTDYDELTDADSTYQTSQTPNVNFHPDESLLISKSETKGIKQRVQSPPVLAHGRPCSEHFMWGKQLDTYVRLAPTTAKQVPILLAARGIYKNNVPGDGSCAYHSVRSAIIDKVNSGCDIKATTQELTIPAMRQIVRCNAAEYCQRQAGDEAHPETVKLMTQQVLQECYNGEHGGINAIAILAEYYNVKVDIYDEIGDVVHNLRGEHQSLPLIILVRVDASEPQSNMMESSPIHDSLPYENKIDSTTSRASNSTAKTSIESNTLSSKKTNVSSTKRFKTPPTPKPTTTPNTKTSGATDEMNNEEDLNYNSPKYQPYGTNPGFAGRRVPPIRYEHYNGTQFSTKDTPWKPGEQAYYWISGKDTMCMVHIIANTGTCKKGFDVYQCAEDATESEDEMIVLKHQQLFAIKEDLDTKLLTNASENEIIRKMNVNLFNTAKFNKYAENLELKGDSILKVINFIENIDSGLKMASSLSYSPMPHISQLSPTTGFREAILEKFPSRSYVFAEAMEYTDTLGTVLGALFKGPKRDDIFNRIKCPRANLAIELCSSRDGWKLLTAIAKVTLPRCGAKINLSAKIQNLSLYEGDTLQDFIRRANNLEESIIRGGVPMTNNNFLQRVLTLLTSCPILAPITTRINRKYSKHRRIHQNDVFKEHVVQYLVEELTDMDIKFSTTLESPLAQNRPRRNHSSRTRTRPSDADPTDNQRLEHGRTKSVRWTRPVDTDPEQHERLENDHQEIKKFDTPNVNRVDTTDFVREPPTPVSSSDESLDDQIDDELAEVFQIEEPPSTNNITAKYCELCDDSVDHETWECKKLDSVNRSEAENKKINLCRLKYQDKLNQKRIRKGMPPIKKSSVTPTKDGTPSKLATPKVTAISEEQKETLNKSDLTEDSEENFDQEDYLGIWSDGLAASNLGNY